MHLSILHDTCIVGTELEEQNWGHIHGDFIHKFLQGTSLCLTACRQNSLKLLTLMSDLFAHLQKFV
jgi:hypothetical protein